MASSATPSKSTPKSAKQDKKNKVIILRLKSDLLSNFPSDSPSQKPSSSESSSSQPAATPIIQPPSGADSPSQSNETPVPATTATDSNSLAPPPADGVKRKGVPGPKPGTKRSLGGANEGTPKPRGKPGPKKKPRLADGTIDRSADATKKGPFSGPAPINTHKLGPKANTGAINAGLRALDRTGKPCRKWVRKGFQCKSFTGFQWDAGSWAAPARSSSTFSGDVKSDSSTTEDVKANMDSSAVSERSASGMEVDGPKQSNGPESSPAPAGSPIAA